MHAVRVTTREQLCSLQEKLDSEENIGIMDIFGNNIDHYLSLKYEGKSIGMAAIIADGNEIAEIFKLYILPEYRKNKYGLYLLREVINRLQRQGFKEIFVETTLNSEKFWEKAKAQYRTKQYDWNKFAILI